VFDSVPCDDSATIEESWQEGRVNQKGAGRALGVRGGGVGLSFVKAQDRHPPSRQDSGQALR